MPNKYYPFDSRLEHRAVGLAALTATATLGTISQKVAMRTEYTTVLNIESIDVASADEKYDLVVEVSNDSFSSYEVAANLVLGHSSTRLASMSNAAGDAYDFEWNTEINGVSYKDARLRLVISGTTPSIGLSCHSTVS